MSRPAQRRTSAAAVVAVFALGAVLQVFLWVRASDAFPQIPQLRTGLAADQVGLLNMGWEFANTRRCRPTAKTMSGGGSIPGCFLQLLVGGPLILWHDGRAPSLVVEAAHFAAGLLLAGTLAKAMGAQFTAIYLLIFWLSPQRLFHSGFIWDPALMVFPAAVHLWSCWKSRDQAGPAASFALGMLLLLAPQTHASFMVLWVLTAILVLRRLIKIDWRGLFGGGIIGFVTLIPTVEGYLDGSAASSLPRDGLIGRGLILIFPLARGFLNWFRMGSLDFGRMGRKDSVFCLSPSLSDSPGSQVMCALVHVCSALSVLSVVVAVAASWWYFRSGSDDSDRAQPDSAWLRRYVLSCFFAVCICAALSPVTIQTWHVLVALPVACIPVAAWIDNLWPPSKAWLRWVVIVFVLLRIPDILLLAYGHPLYRALPADIVDVVRE
jgi:hypothetical protein